VEVDLTRISSLESRIYSSIDWPLGIGPVLKLRVTSYVTGTLLPT
jgi:hypothetical protein